MKKGKTLLLGVATFLSALTTAPSQAGTYKSHVIETGNSYTREVAGKTYTIKSLIKVTNIRREMELGYRTLICDDYSCIFQDAVASIFKADGRITDQDFQWIFREENHFGPGEFIINNPQAKRIATDYRQRQEALQAAKNYYQNFFRGGYIDQVDGGDEIFKRLEQTLKEARDIVNSYQRDPEKAFRFAKFLAGRDVVNRTGTNLKIRRSTPEEDRALQEKYNKFVYPYAVTFSTKDVKLRYFLCLQDSFQAEACTAQLEKLEDVLSGGDAKKVSSKLNVLLKMLPELTMETFFASWYVDSDHVMATYEHDGNSYNVKLTAVDSEQVTVDDLLFAFFQGRENIDS